MQVSGKFKCDNCGGSAGNGGVQDCIIVSDLNSDSGAVINHHFCRAHKCDKEVLREAVLRAYRATMNSGGSGE